MDIVIYALGTYGDVYPFLSLAKRLSQSGRKVVFLGNEVFGESVIQHGVEFVAVTGAQLYLDTYLNPLTWSPGGSFSHYQTYHFAAAEKTYEYIRTLVKGGEEPFLIFQDPLSGARMACDEMGLKYAQIVLSPSTLHSDKSPSFPLRQQVQERWRPEIMPKVRKRLLSNTMTALVEPLINPLRLKLGLAAWSENEIPAITDGECLIAMFPEWFRPVPSDWPPNLFLAGFPSFEVDDRSTRAEVSDFLQEHERPIVFTLGTGVSVSNEFIRKAADICSAFSAPGIIVDKYMSDPTCFGPGPILRVREVDYGFLFRHAMAVVHHGGIGTAAQALTAGTPQLVLPLSFDQPDNAFWLWELGVANAIDAKDFSVEEAILAVDHLVSDTAVRESLQRCKDRLRDHDAVEAATQHIERYLVTTSAC